jgi:hypothetical protein
MEDIIPAIDDRSDDEQALEQTPQRRQSPVAESYYQTGDAQRQTSGKDLILELSL